MTTLLAFLFTLAVLILVHEWGHYRVAKACGVKVLRFSVGFGRPLWRKQRGETEWVIGSLPFGGYVKMLDEREGAVPVAEASRAFNRKSLWQRSAIVLAGPLANLLLAVALYASAYWIGTDEPRAWLSTPTPGSLAERAGLQAQDWVRALSTDEDDDGWQDVSSMTDLRWLITRAALSGQDVRLQVSDSDGHGLREVDLPLSVLGAKDIDATLMRRIGLGAPFSEPLLGQLTAGGPADLAGLQSGDLVLSVDGRAVRDGAQLRQLIRSWPTDSAAAAGAQPVQVWRVQRGGRELEVNVTPLVVDDHGQKVGRVQAVVGAAPVMDFVSLGPMQGLTRAWYRTSEMAGLTLRMFGRMLIGEASLKNISGPLTIADYAGQSVQLGLAYYLGFLAVVSVSLGVLNLLPLPMLDGGHLLYYLVEGVVGRPIPDVWMERLQRGGLLVVMLMMSLALYNDVARLMGLH